MALDIKEGARIYRARMDRREKLRDSLMLVFMAALSLWLTFDQMIL